MNQHCSISTSATTIRNIHHNLAEHLGQDSVSVPSSPRSSALPSPPDSPLSGSVSSLPSVSSSFFFSSAAASPPQQSRPHSDHGTQGLIIPSLMLPDALHRPTPYGQTLGELRLFLFGRKGSGKSLLAGLLLEDNEDVVEVSAWEEIGQTKVLRASTDWIEHNDLHGLEKFEPTRNVEIVELPGYDNNDDGNELVRNMNAIIQAPFHAVSGLLHPDHQPSQVVANMISSSCSPLYTALVFLLPSAPTELDRLLMDHLSQVLPVIVLPRLQNIKRDPALNKLSAFCPASATALRTGLFHSPETLALLRSEATDRFLRWHEVERAVRDINVCRHQESATHSVNNRSWDKAKWESEWMSSLSHDVATRLREGTVTERDLHTSSYMADSESSDMSDNNPCHILPGFDPLHLPSVIAFSVSLLGPLHKRLKRSFAEFFESLGDMHVKLALLGGFCAGLGFGMFFR